MAPCDKLNSCISNPTSPGKMVNSDEGVVSEVASDKFWKGQSPDMKIDGVELSKKVSTPAIIAKKTLQGPNNEDIALQSDKGHISSVKPEKVSQSSCTGVLALIPSQEGRASSMTPKKASHTPDSSVRTFKSGPEGSVHSVVHTSDDGYNWRKYGQKNVKGNEYIRSYYRCTYPNCQVKRQLERSHEGQITDTVYFGQHDHPKPQANLPLAVGFVVSIVEDRSTEPSATSANDKMCNLAIKTPNKMEHPAVATSDAAKSVLSQQNRRRGEIDNNDAPDTKRQRKGNLNASSVDKSTEQRVVKTVSEVDIVNDGYRWRKYGQKLVKGNPNPRSYYRCSSTGCPAKKHVERASHDPKMVIATYEGQHDHDMPPGRTVTPNTAGQNNQIIALDGRENDTVCLDMVVHTSLDPHGIPSGRTSVHETVGEQNQTAANEETRESDTVCLNTHVHKNPGLIIKSDEQLNGESGKSEVCDAVSPNMAVQSSLGKNVESGAKSEENDTEGPESRPNGESKTKTEDDDDVSHDPASISKEQQTPNAEAVHNHKLLKVLQNDDDDD